MNSITAAKRRRAGVQVAASPMFKAGASAPTTGQIQVNKPPVRMQNSSYTPSIPTDTTTIYTKKPMPLQQVISVLDNRILYLENHLVKSTDEPQLVNTDSSKNQDTSNSINKDEVENIIVDTIKNHMSEFNDRYELLASEIVNIKQIVLQLQSYTLDVNKTLLGDRDHLLELINKSNQQPISANIAQELAEESQDAEDAQVAEESQDAQVAEESQDAEDVEDVEESQDAEDAQVAEDVEDVEESLDAEDVEESQDAEDAPVSEESHDDASQNIQVELTEETQEVTHIEKKKGKRKGKNKNIVQVTLAESQ